MHAYVIKNNGSSNNLPCSLELIRISSNKNIIIAWKIGLFFKKCLTLAT